MFWLSMHALEPPATSPCFVIRVPSWFQNVIQPCSPKREWIVQCGCYLFISHKWPSSFSNWQHVRFMFSWVNIIILVKSPILFLLPPHILLICQPRGFISLRCKHFPTVGSLVSFLFLCYMFLLKLPIKYIHRHTTTN